ncbi:peptidase M48-like protein [Hydrogenispora ethanolica]|uniref:Peptidase M48-like protein n=1 Tax=Hydrogenispora ethanolica TaxID=1082276 RepID=A0A4R1R7E4_HYDET|nr:M48 family metallopeptidase [Hydrogenispora ethanolica]TCL61535.1 peptidase M48-like protein [Hydrogenispora ethanolica]
MLRKRWPLFMALLLLVLMVSGSTIRAESVFDNISLGLEKEIGYLNYETILATKEPVQLPSVENRRLQAVFHRLTETSRRKGEIQYHLTVVEDPAVNAFALPGGYVFVNTGLLEVVQSDDELAGVLGHELAHVECRHSIKAITRSVGMTAVATAALGSGEGSSRETLSRMANLSILLLQLGYSRDAEYEADKLGVQMMREAGYSKNKFLNFWRRDEAANDSGRTARFYEFFSTHPLTSERIKRIESM